LFDVIVVGAGPAGSRTAAQLARQGLDVAVLEKRSAIGAKPCCTGIISSECVSAFDIPFSVISNSVNKALIFGPQGSPVEVMRPQPHAHIVDRRLFDIHLAEQARDAGAVYHLGTHVRDMKITAGGVVLTAVSGGHQRDLHARAIALATGFNSSLVKRTGLGNPSFFTTGVQVEAESSVITDVEIYFDQKRAPGFFAWLVPLRNGKCLVGLMSNKNPGLLLREWLDELILQKRIAKSEYIIRYSGIPLKPIKRTYAERLIVVGDAAGQTKPTTGGGIYFGMLCADIAAETLHKACLDNDYSSKILSSYQKNWQNKLKKELNIQYLSRRLYQRLSDENIGKIMDKLRSSQIVEKTLQDKNLSFDWHGTVLLNSLKKVTPGELFRLISS